MRIEEKIKEILKSEKKVAFAYIFGSFIYNKNSNDIDLAIYVVGKVGKNLSKNLH